MLGIAAIPSTLITLALLRLPDTARWYMMQGRRQEARSTLARVKGRGVDLDAELDDMQAALAQVNKDSWREMLRKPFLRATIFVVGLAFFVQITPNAQQGMNDVRVLDREPSHGAVHLAQALALLGHPTNTR